ncbi:hypothetical protein AGMMS4956_19670 [Bacteroidia bacterium]|nr:hypothetical protein AGMMS4956_19670 [Bacteroidia bacterium]
MSSVKFYTFCGELGKFFTNLATAAFILVFVTPFFGNEFALFGNGELIFDMDTAAKGIKLNRRHRLLSV